MKLLTGMIVHRILWWAQDVAFDVRLYHLGAWLVDAAVSVSHWSGYEPWGDYTNWGGTSSDD